MGCAGGFCICAKCFAQNESPTHLPLSWRVLISTIAEFGLFRAIRFIGLGTTFCVKGGAWTAAVSVLTGNSPPLSAVGLCSFTPREEERLPFTRCDAVC